MIHFLVKFIYEKKKQKTKSVHILFLFIEDTYWKPDIVDQQEVLVKVMDTYGKVNENIFFFH